MFECESSGGTSGTVDGADAFGLCFPEEAEDVAADTGAAWFSDL